MEHAILIEKTSRKFVNIKDVKEKFGVEGARRQTYHCPSEWCGVKMITVFPTKLRRDGKEVHSRHFRAKPEPHTPACTGDGERADLIEHSTGSATDVKPRYELVRRASFPMRYIKSSRARRAVPGQTINPGIEESEPYEQKERKPDETRPGIHTSRPETGHIRHIVQAYENPPFKLHFMGLRLPGCPAKNYADAFVDVIHAVDELGEAGAPYIFKGSYGEHLNDSNDGISIIFSELAPDGKNLCVLVKPELGPAVKREEIKQKLWRASLEMNATVYVFGRFRSFSDGEYTLEIKALGDLWITFKNNSLVANSVTIAEPNA